MAQRAQHDMLTVQVSPAKVPSQPEGLQAPLAGSATVPVHTEEENKHHHHKSTAAAAMAAVITVVVITTAAAQHHTPNAFT